LTDPKAGGIATAGPVAEARMGGHDTARRTALYDDHVKAGGKLVPFAGFMLPIQYRGIVDEHERVRRSVGLFDVSHMGEVLFRGPRAVATVNRIITNDVASAKPGRAVYTAVCLPHGGIVDDMIAYKVSDTEVFICVNASNKDKDYRWFVEAAAGDCEVLDQSDEYSQIAVQGPRAPELLGRALGPDVAAMKPFTFQRKTFDGADVIVATTGYTGEKGGEVYVPNGAASALWKRLMELGADLDVGPIGLGARDTLRLEMKYCLYGNDIDETTTPLEAGIGWTVKFDKGDFTGRAALAKQRDAGLKRSLVAFVVEGKGIPRHEYAIYAGDAKVGHVTSGTLSPSLKVPVGLGYVDVPHDRVGTTIEIDLKGLRRAAAKVVEPPLYKKG
jgi:aminomethyltransferase